tara:strand:- start:14074 stop:15120 length:1047 start_codon:yes stop_codon:yes gene_type:complete
MNWLNRILYLLNMLTLFAMALSYLAPHISPSTFLWPIAFLGLLYPILLLTNVVFALYWFVSFKRYFWSNFFIILIGWGQFSTLINIESKKTNTEDSFTVMSYNVRLFNVYKWINNKNVKNEIVDYINTVKPNILCLQEFYAPNELPNIQLPYQHIGLQSQKKQWRMATYSSFPIINKGTVSIKGERKNNICIYSDLVTEKDTIRLYNIHLASNWFRPSDYSFIQNPTLETEELKKNVLSIGKRLKNSFVKRAEQVEAIKTHINKSPYPVILCGDFNDTPSSYAYNQLSKGLKDAFVEKGRGLGRSYNGKFPSLRIDYILCSPELNINSFDTRDVKLSDHYPVVAGFRD